MEIEYIGALDYKKINNLLQEEINDETKVESLVKKIMEVEKARHSEIVSTAGRLSRTKGTILDVLELSEGKTEQANSKFASMILNMGHKSISDHDYLVFAIKNVSVAIEQMIIAERIASFTIKSRREVDFSKEGYYTPDFHNESGELIDNNEEMKEKYNNHMDKLFNNYKVLLDNNISPEDARFVLPYCYHSNIIMGVDAHTLSDMIVKFTKTKYSKVGEFRQFGEELYNIAKEYAPYLIDDIDKKEVKEEDDVDKYLSEKIDKEEYYILDKVKLLNSSKNIDDNILISAIMKRYQYPYDKAEKVYLKLCEDVSFKDELMKKIAFGDDKLELTQVNFQFQIPVSYAILTHLTRHRTHKIIVPDFFPNVDLNQYKTPPKIKNNCNEFYKEIYEKNSNMYNYFKENGIRDEDLIYFTLSGNMVNILTNMDGWTVRHILELRECNKAQWETREIARGIHSEIAKLDNVESFTKVLGATCETRGICNEGKESCGKVKILKQNNN